MNTVDDLAKPLDNKLYFAGTATSPPASTGSAHGAYESGLRVAREAVHV
ncbi:MAG: FAD-dependent oxidoreductase [Chloroflexota bacterium]